jgi:hypothetical protein
MADLHHEISLGWCRMMGLHADPIALLISAGGCQAGIPARLTWPQMKQVVAHNVNVTLPDGTVVSGKAQYCSLNNHESCVKVNPVRGLPLSRTQGIVAHLAFYSTRVEAASTGGDPLLKDLFEDSLMKDFLLPRGE